MGSHLPAPISPAFTLSGKPAVPRRLGGVYFVGLGSCGEVRRQSDADGKEALFHGRWGTNVEPASRPVILERPTATWPADRRPQHADRRPPGERATAL